MLLRGDAVERSMDAERRYHIECATAEYVRRGLLPPAARRRASLEFGGIEAVTQASRDTLAAGRWSMPTA